MSNDSNEYFGRRAMLFVEKIGAFADENALFVDGAKHIVALSGGADSVALLRVMKQLNIDVEAATCNFHLRGEESDRDEKFCIALCERLGVKIHLAHFDTKEYARLHGVSIEMAARTLRYNFFERLRQDVGAVSICVAHHRDDSVETLLINLIRGTGLRGLRGIVPKNGNIIRPLLCVSRGEIESFLDEIGQNYVTDSTNLVDDVMRNKVRLDLLPLLEKINPSVRTNIFETSQHVVEALKLLDNATADGISKVRKDNTIFVDKLLSQPAPEHLLFCILHDYGFTSPVIAQIFRSLGSESGKVWYSPTHDLLLDRNQLLLQEHTDEKPKAMKVIEQGTYIYKKNSKFAISVQSIDESYTIDKSRSCACLDASKVEFPLTIRGIETGDKFMPLGMKQMKLVSDYLTDKKRSLFDKRAQLVVTDARGNIVWLVNERPDNRYKITPQTKSVLKILLHE